MVHFRYLPGIIGLWLFWLLLSGCTPSAAPTPAAQERPSAGTRIEPPRAVADFTLTSHTGAPLSLSSLRGQATLLYFGYTFCPDICPTTLAELVRVKRSLGPLADRVAFVFISVDGPRDTPEVLARYLPAFDPDFIGLTGTEREIRKIGVDYGLFFEAQKVEGTSADYLVDHSAASYLIDPEGRLHTIYPYGTPAEVIATDLRAMLGEPGE
ncbi:MAG: SCO family protein [Chloroflexaceae bacterium]|nr:SCO family protein [Chloroflexaceae bacterium]